MKKLSLVLFVVLITSCISPACKKDDDLQRTVAGYWKGKYLGNPNTDWSWLVRQDGTLRVYIGTDSVVAAKYNGTYITTDSTITATYSVSGGINTVVNAKLNSAYTHMEGSDFFGYNYYLDK